MGYQDQSPNNHMQRVKVHRLNEDGKWDDQGTGHVTVDYLESSDDLGLFVIDEEDNETLLLHRISSEDIFRKEEDSIISFWNPESASEFAVSFQERTHCSYIWDTLCSLQRHMHSDSNTELRKGEETNGEIKESHDTQPVAQGLQKLHQTDGTQISEEPEVCKETR